MARKKVKRNPKKAPVTKVQLAKELNELHARNGFLTQAVIAWEALEIMRKHNTPETAITRARLGIEVNRSLMCKAIPIVSHAHLVFLPGAIMDLISYGSPIQVINGEYNHIKAESSFWYDTNKPDPFFVSNFPNFKPVPGKPAISGPENSE